jgi:hypothetical protein
MTQGENQERMEPAQPSLDNGDAGRQVAYVTGMSPDAAQTFVAFHSGRFHSSTSFRGGA